jgi:predicted DNA-binding transcriptional regulator YafY
MTRGRRQSQWSVLRRCLAIIRRTQRGPANWRELVHAVLSHDADAYGGVQDQAQHRRLENDLRRIRDELLVDLYYDCHAGGYVIRGAWLPLLDLPDDDLATIAWLEETFDLESPQHDEVHALLDKLRLYLGPERLAAIERSRTALTVNLRQRDEDEISPAVWDGLTKALSQHRRIEFLYLSPQYGDGKPRRHVVDPYDRYFDTARGHYYLRAYCRRADSSGGLEVPHCYITYRVGRISDLEVLPQKLSPVSPAAPCYEVMYELAPQVARLGVSRQPEIEIHEVEYRDDDSALVRGETDSLFWAVRSLLHYGPNCRVVGGPEMLREMQAVVQGMVKVYEED